MPLSAEEQVTLDRNSSNDCEIEVNQMAENQKESRLNSLPGWTDQRQPRPGGLSRRPKLSRRERVEVSSLASLGKTKDADLGGSQEKGQKKNS